MFIEARTEDTTNDLILDTYNKICKEFTNLLKHQQVALFNRMRNEYNNRIFFTREDVNSFNERILQICTYGNEETRCINIYESTNGVEVRIVDYKNLV